MSNDREELGNALRSGIRSAFGGARDRADQATDQVQDIGSDVRGRTETVADRLRDRGESATDRATDVGDNVRERAESAVDRGRDVGARVRDRAGSTVERVADESRDIVADARDPEVRTQTTDLLEQPDRDAAIVRSRDESVGASVSTAGRAIELSGARVTEALDERVPETDAGPNVGLGTSRESISSGDPVGQQVRDLAVGTPAGGAALGGMAARAGGDIVAQGEYVAGRDIDRDAFAGTEQTGESVRSAGEQTAAGVQQQPVAAAIGAAGPGAASSLARRGASADLPQRGSLAADDRATASPIGIGQRRDGDQSSGDSSRGASESLDELMANFERGERLRGARQRAEQRTLEQNLEAGRRQERGDQPRTIEDTGPGGDFVAEPSREIRSADPSRFRDSGPTSQQMASRRSSVTDPDLSPRESQLAAQLGRETPGSDLRTATDMSAPAAPAGGFGTPDLSSAGLIGGVGVAATPQPEISQREVSQPSVDQPDDGFTRTEEDLSVPVQSAQSPRIAWTQEQPESGALDSSFELAPEGVAFGVPPQESTATNVAQDQFIGQQTGLSVDSEQSTAAPVDAVPSQDPGTGGSPFGFLPQDQPGASQDRVPRLFVPGGGQPSTRPPRLPRPDDEEPDPEIDPFGAEALGFGDWLNPVVSPAEVTGSAGSESGADTPEATLSSMLGGGFDADRP